MRVGDICDSNKFGRFEVARDLGRGVIEIRFLGTGYRASYQRSKAKRGAVRDPFMPMVFGVGYTGKGIHKSTVGGKSSREYTIWRAMLERCYSARKVMQSPTYSSCKVCIEWHNFQNFAGWYKNNIFNGGQIDKDILVSGNKIYSPSTCLIVSAKENAQHAKGVLGRVVTVAHPIHGDVEFGCAEEFSKLYGVDSSGLCKVINGRRNHVGGWSLVSCLDIALIFNDFS